MRCAIGLIPDIATYRGKKHEHDRCDTASVFEDACHVFNARHLGEVWPEQG